MNDITRRTFLGSGAALAAGLGAYSLTTSDSDETTTVHPQDTERETLGHLSNRVETQPNVIVFLTDDQGYGDIESHGNPDVLTPQLDRLRSQSIDLTDFHAASVCAPTRAMLMTGRESLRTGVSSTIRGREYMHLDEITMADIFKANGYRTGLIGKWHLGDVNPFRPDDRGFDHVVGFRGGALGQTPDYWGNDGFGDVYYVNGQPRKFNGYCTKVWMDEALQFVRQEHTAGNPFFAYIAPNAPHKPLVAPKWAQDIYADADLPEDVKTFYAMITAFDRQFKRFMNRLNSWGLNRDTILIFIGDNGSLFAEYAAGIRSNKGSPYDGGHRVPCFIRWRGTLPEDIALGHLTSATDILPTLIELCGLDADPAIANGFDGISLADLLLNRTAPYPSRTLFRTLNTSATRWEQTAVLTDRWRLVNGDELYDVRGDHEQKDDLAAQRSNIVEDLRNRYQQFITEVLPRARGPVRIPLGGRAGDPVTQHLTAMDWNTPGRVPIRQRVIQNAPTIDGAWSVHVPVGGRYRIALRRWPEEVSAPINGKPAGESGTRISAQTAHLTIGPRVRFRRIDAGDEESVFFVHLPKGPTELHGWFESTDGNRGAYYATVSRA